MRIAANLGFLWTELSLPDAIRAADRAGFDAVECHWPYAVDVSAVQEALADTGLPMLGLNTSKGDRPDDFGLAAMPGAEGKARAAIEQAFEYGAAIGAGAVHVMAGVGGEDDVFEENLAYACDVAAANGMMVLIEPINARDKPGYHLATLEHAARIVDAVARRELKIMFDVYHLQIMGGDLIRRFETHRDAIGHVQIASVPARAEPDEGEIAFDRLLGAFRTAGYAGDLGAEYRPRTGNTEAGLAWLPPLRESLG